MSNHIQQELDGVKAKLSGALSGYWFAFDKLVGTKSQWKAACKNRLGNCQQETRIMRQEASNQTVVVFAFDGVERPSNFLIRMKWHPRPSSLSLLETCILSFLTANRKK